MIQTEDIKLYRSFENSIYSTNGGLLTTYVLQSGSMGNIFKNVTDSERLSGSTTYVKVFWKIDNVDNTSLTNVFTYMSKYTIGADFITYGYRDWETDRKSTRLNSSHSAKSRMPSSA